jgi:hypothetical protein
MREHVRHVNGPEVLGAELHSDVLEKGWRVRAHVDDDIPNCAADAADELRFARGWHLIVHSAHGALLVIVGHVRLHHLWPQAMLIKLARAECPCEKAPVVVLLVEFDNKGTLEFGFVKDQWFDGFGLGLSESCFPEEILVDLVGADQILELFEPGERSEPEILLSEIDLLEGFVELLGTLGHIPVAGEVRQVFRELVEADPVAAVVSALRAEGRRATLKS